MVELNLGSEVVLEVGERAKFFENFSDFHYDIEDVGSYAHYGYYPISNKISNKIKEASNELWKVVQKAKKGIQKLSDKELLYLGFREEMIPFLKLDYLKHSNALSRFDFIINEEEESVKMIEINDDTPFLVQETFQINNAMLDSLGLDKPFPNALEEMVKSYDNAIRDCMLYLKKYSPNIAILSYTKEVDLEEWCTVNFIKDSIISETGYDIKHIYMEDLRIVTDFSEHHERGLYDSNMNKIDILIRPAYPIEFLIDDYSEDGDSIGIEMLKLVQEQKLATINSPSSVILQNKMVMAFIWHLYANNEFFNEHEKAVIEEFMLPSYVSSEPFNNNNLSYVAKPSFSREGSSIFVVKDGEESKSDSMTYNDYDYMYQKYKEMPVIKFGDSYKKMLIGSFICNDKSVGIACRIGNEITDWDSYWTAITAKD